MQIEGRISFSQFFVDQLLAGDSLNQAYLKAKIQLANMGLPYSKMQPKLEGSVPSATSIKLGGDFAIASLFATISETSPSTAITANPPSPIPFYSRLSSLEGIDAVWAVVVPPNDTPPDPSQNLEAPSQRQTLLFSATFDAAVEQLAVKSLRLPQRFSMGTDAPSDTVAHTLYPVPQHLKPGLLQRLLGELTVDSILVFTRTKHRADRVAEKIQRAGYAASALHSNKSQGQRKQAMDQFRNGKIKVLVATDIAARGLDIASISHVINFDIPDSATSYIHRIGRTGRAERLGDAFTLVTREDKDTIRDIEKALGTPIERKMLEGFNYNEVIEKNVRTFTPPQVHDTSRTRSLQRRYA
jgi:hypothetical protein